MTGGGSGGLAVVLVEATSVQVVGNAVMKALAARAYGRPEMSEVVACDGASRVA